MADPALNLKVNVTGAQQGAAQLNQVAAATDKTTAAAGKSVGATKGAADATKSLGQALKDLGKGNPAKDVVDGLKGAAQGGAGAFFNLAKAARGAFAVITGGPIGAIVGLLGLAATAAIAFGVSLLKPKKSAEELAAELAAAKKGAEELGQSRLNQLNTDLASIKAQANEATQALDDVLAAQKRIADQEKNTALAVNRNDATITETERTKREFAINDRFSTSEDARSLQSLAGREEIAKKVVDQEKQANAENEREYRAALAERNEIKTKAARLQELPGLIESSRVVVPGLGTTREGSQTQTLRQEQAALSQQIGDPVTALGLNDTRFKTAQDNAQKGRNAIFEAEKALAAATKKLATERDVQGKVSPLREQEIAATQKAAVKEASKADLEKAQQRKTTTEDFQKLEQEIRAAQEASDFTKQSELIGEFNKRKKLADLEGPARVPEKAPLTAQKISTFAPSQKAAAPALDQAAQEIQNTPPLDAAPIAEPVKEISTSVQENAAQSQAAIQQAGAQISEQAANVPPPADLTPLVQAVTSLDAARQAQHEALKQQVADLSRQLNTLAMSARRSAAA